MRRNMKRSVFVIVLLAMTVLLSGSVFAKTGWNSNKSGKKVWFELAAEDGTTTRVTGFVTIGKNSYFFDEAGYLKTKWVATEEGFRYFEPEGKPGKVGAMYKSGVYQIGKKYFGFGEDGIVLTGFQKVKKAWYYFSPSENLGVRGKALTNRFVDLEDGRTVFLESDGRMAKKKWVKGEKYYVNKKGELLRNTVTPDGYLVNAKGKKKKKAPDGWIKIDGAYHFYNLSKKKLYKNKVFKYKNKYYYVDEDGVRQTGWQTVGSHTYYFKKNGAAVTGTKTIGGETYVFDSKGRLNGNATDKYSTGTKATTGKASILIMCGHGQGDSGAVSSLGQESVKTREFGKLIYSALKEDPTVDVYLFNTNYDMYQQNSATLGNAGVLSSVTGGGSKRSKVISTLASNSRIPDLTKYDYAIEIHFNATGYASKDEKGNGSKKGTGTYVNVHKSSSNRAIDRKIIKALNGVGMPTWGSGVYGSSGLVNARVFTELGVNYSLLETCFIDDRDDMSFYNKNKTKMAKAVADTIVAYFK